MDHDGPAFHVSAEALAERVDKGRRGRLGAGQEKADARDHPRLLRLGGERRQEDSEGQRDDKADCSGSHAGLLASPPHLRDDVKPPDLRRAVHCEVPAVDGEDPPDAFALGNAHKGRIRQVHGKIPVFLHELSHA